MADYYQAAVDRIRLIGLSLDERSFSMILINAQVIKYNNTHITIANILPLPLSSYQHIGLRVQVIKHPFDPVDVDTQIMQFFLRDLRNEISNAAAILVEVVGGVTTPLFYLSNSEVHGIETGAGLSVPFNVDVDTYPQYQKESEKGVSGGYASLGLDGKVPIGELPAMGVVSHAATHHSGGADVLDLGLLAGTITTTQHGTLATGDPHPQYALDATLEAHESASDPHTGYQRESEKGAASGYAGLDAGSKVPLAQIPTIPIAQLDTDVATQAELDAHAAAADPHTGYQRESEKNAASGYAGLSAGTKLSGAQQVYGTAVDTACQGNDARLSDARTPLAHKTSHQDAGTDEINVAGLSGVLADPQPPIIGAGGTQAVAGNDARLTDARTPTVHATSHKSGGADAIKLDELAATTDVTTLNASTAAHGLCPKFPGDTSTFLRADGSFAAPPGGGGSANIKNATVDFGLIPARIKRITITDVDVSPTSQLMISNGSDVPVNWPASAVDEWEMDPAVFTARPGTGEFYLNIATQTPLGIVGTRSINYLVG